MPRDLNSKLSGSKEIISPVYPISFLISSENCPELAPISKTSPILYDLSKAFLRPVGQDSREKK
jgi:hypothetical protein